MRKLFLKITCLLIGLTLIMSTFTVVPAFADGNSSSSGKNCVQTTFFDEQCDSKGIEKVLSAAVDIATVAIGILATAGIAFAGVQYLTAGDNEEKVRKSKRRIFEIVIGLAIYVLIYSMLRWLLPHFNGFSSGGSGGEEVSYSIVQQQ